MERQDRPARCEVLIFELDRLRFTFRAIDEIRFGRHAGNTLRGALGILLRRTATPEMYENIFEPRASEGPSGYRNAPRPFVLRCSHLNTARVAAGDLFSVNVHSFELRDPDKLHGALRLALAEMETEGVGAGRSRARLLLEERPAERVVISLNPSQEAMERIAVEFRTPTELKGYALGELSFGVLFCRVRDRICTLSSRYGASAIEVDHQELGNLCDSVRTEDTRLERLGSKRRSSRTGEVHSIGGFTGTATFAGDLAGFAGWLTAAKYTGVGKHTVWGNGEIDWH